MITSDGVVPTSFDSDSASAKVAENLIPPAGTIGILAGIDDSNIDRIAAEVFGAMAGGKVQTAIPGAAMTSPPVPEAIPASMLPGTTAPMSHPEAPMPSASAP